MKYIVLLFVTVICTFSLNAQIQKNSLRGKITDPGNNSLAGVNVIVVGTKFGVNANETGEYYLDQLPAGKIKIRASSVGFNTSIIEIDIKPGQNSLDIRMESAEIKLEGITVSSQKREQQVIDVPITMSVIKDRFMEDNNITELDKLSEFVPGLLVRMQGIDRPSFVIRGITSDEVSPAAQPRISVYYNNVPINRANGAAVELFDMKQIDVLKGPQGTLFGRGAEIGAINYISNVPASNFGGDITVGVGNYSRKEIRGSINIPVIKDRLFVRAAGIYDFQEGYIKNTFRGNLNGKNTIAGRLSATYLPNTRNKIDVVINYQKDDNPGLGFMSMSYPNTAGIKDPFKYTASLEQGKNLKNTREIFDASLTVKHSFNEKTYMTSISSYRRISSFSRWDGDGTAAAAIDMSEDDGSQQFYQELRYNSSINNKLTGSIGSSFWYDKSTQNYWFSPNEQNMFHLLFNTGFLVTPDGQPYPITNLPPDPQLGPLAGLPLVTDHQEKNNNGAVNQSLDGFADANYQITKNLSLTGGLRLTNDWIKLTNSAQMSGGSPATLGFLTGNYPNLFFKESSEQSINSSNLAFTFRTGLKYSVNEHSILFASYSKGHRPKFLQFTSSGEKQVLDAETLHSFDLGLKTAIKQRLWFDLGLFYYSYLNFQTSAWVADSSTGEYNYIVKNGGKASGYGAEMNMNYVLFTWLKFFGNYTNIHTRFANYDATGAKQEYAGNKFRLTPEQSFALGLNTRIGISKNFFLFAAPSYSYRTKIFFEDANTPGLEQAGYGLVNIRAGVEYKKIILAFWGNNLSGQKYIVSAGNTGSLFGDPTQIPGAPIMFGTKLSLKF